MNELADLYQELIIDHNKRPRNFGELDPADRTAHGDNPLCGDKLDLSLTFDGETITDMKFSGSGCAISTASASLMTEAVKGKTIAEAKVLFERFHHLITGEKSPDDPTAESLGKLAAFSNVGRYPARVKCATLAWHTLQAALSKRDDTTVTTE